MMDQTQNPSRTARLRAMIRRLRKDTRAVALVETAVTLPTLLVTSFGGLEIANLMTTHTRISGIALAAADNASRIAAGSNLALPQVREVDINDVFTGSQLQSGTLDLNANGRIIISSLEINASDGQWIHWQRCYGTLDAASAYGPQGTGAVGTSFPGMGAEGAEVKASVGAPIMFVEVSYKYKPIIANGLISSDIRIEYDAAFTVRDARDTSAIFNPNPVAPVRSCLGGTPRKKGNKGKGNAWGFGKY